MLGWTCAQGMWVSHVLVWYVRIACTCIWYSFGTKQWITWFPNCVDFVCMCSFHDDHDESCHPITSNFENLSEDHMVPTCVNLIPYNKTNICLHQNRAGLGTTQNYWSCFTSCQSIVNLPLLGWLVQVLAQGNYYGLGRYLEPWKLRQTKGFAIKSSRSFGIQGYLPWNWR